MKNNRDGDSWMFREAMADVEPLESPNRIEPVAKKTPAVARQRELDEKTVLSELLQPLSDPAELETGEEILYLRDGTQKRVFRRLRRGHYSIADSIDLHHMNVETASNVLLDFIEHSIRSGHGCIRVIHGKGLSSPGLPRLKPMVSRTLRKHPRVIAFASCRPMDGGTGAVTVLLSLKKRRRP